jgi:putative transcriptional regulator
MGKKDCDKRAALSNAVNEMANGLVDADLGGGVFKKRVALPGKGKRGGVRTLLATNLKDKLKKRSMPESWWRLNMKKKSRLLDEIHETASDLHRLGFIDKRSMAKYAALCIPQVPDYSPVEIKSIREKYNISQAVLAAILNTSLSTVQKWEVGEKHPGGPSKKLLFILERKGIEAMM